MHINRQQPIYHCFLYIFVLLILSSCATTEPAEQEPNQNTTRTMPPDGSGMWLMPQLDGPLLATLKSRGLKIPGDSLYRTTAPSLSQAVVRININKNLGSSGSFVSPNGLILTNQGVINNALASASSTQNNYLTEGFYADSRANEIPLPNYSIYIPVEQKEVTAQINHHLPDSLTYREQLLKSQEVRKNLIAQRKAINPNLVVEINDFWGGNRQFMSTYKIIRDIRLVHAPPESLATDTSNHDWPQNAVDYAFLRAYVDSSGNSSTYEAGNVPFSPAKHFDIGTDQISDNGFTMVMGFPGETSRHASSYELEFYHNYRNPIIIDAYQAILDGLDYAANQNPEQVQNAAQRISLENTISYYQSLQQGIESQGIIKEKQKIEQGFKEWVKKDSLRNRRYRRVLDQLDQAYSIASQTGDLLHATVYAINNIRLFQIAALYDSHRKLLENGGQEKISSSYKDSLITRHQKLLNPINVEAQQITLSQMLHMLATLPDGKVPFHLLEVLGDAKGEALRNEIDRYLQKQRETSVIYDTNRARKFLTLPVDSARQHKIDGLVQLYRAMLENYQFSRKNYVQYVAYQKPAQKRYIQGMLEYKPDLFQYPDANGTLRLSIGRVNAPDDSLYNAPITTLGDLNDVAFDGPNNLPVNFITTNDITGGNAGSPVLNAKGNLLGITFNNTTTGVASDYKFHPERSRSIGVSLQYILFVMDYLNTDRLLKEME